MKVIINRKVIFFSSIDGMTKAFVFVACDRNVFNWDIDIRIFSFGNFGLRYLFKDFDIV